jgi:hypothetical protein
VLDQPESLNGEERRENALGNPAFFGLVQSTPHRHEDPEFLESCGVWTSVHRGTCMMDFLKYSVLN